MIKIEYVWQKYVWQNLSIAGMLNNYFCRVLQSRMVLLAT